MSTVKTTNSVFTAGHSQINYSADYQRLRYPIKPEKWKERETGFNKLLAKMGYHPQRWRDRVLDREQHIWNDHDFYTVEEVFIVEEERKMMTPKPPKAYDPTRENRQAQLRAWRKMSR